MPAAGRRSARRLAVEILYQSDVTGRRPFEVISEWRAAGRRVPDYAEELAVGVAASLDEIDALLARHSEDWSVHRMPVVDRTILRIASYELLRGLPAGIAINEAVEAAAELSTLDSGRFVNGVLGKLARDLGDRQR